MRTRCCTKTYVNEGTVCLYPDDHLEFSASNTKYLLLKHPFSLAYYTRQDLLNVMDIDLIYVSLISKEE